MVIHLTDGGEAGKDETFSADGATIVIIHGAIAHPLRKEQNGECDQNCRRNTQCTSKAMDIRKQTEKKRQGLYIPYP